MFFSLSAIREQIPKEYRAAARCEIDSNSGYEGSHYAHIEVTYERPETDKEWAARKTDVTRRADYWAAQDAANDAAEFERLKAKFSGTER